MPQDDFTPSPAFRPAGPKTRMTIYFAMLILSLIAMLIACVFMFLEVKNFGGFGAVPGKVSLLEHSRPMMIAAECHRTLAA
jgi:hypothetical protein